MTTTDDFVVVASGINKTYDLETTKIDVLHDVDFDIAGGEFAVIKGASGAGKTTLLNLISGIDRPTKGKIVVFHEDLTEKDESHLADFRCRNIGYVFQSYNLISTLTVAENIAFPMEWLRREPHHIETRVDDLLDALGLQNRSEHFPFQLSGGEQQRAAFARSLANDPPLLLVDEPTGNLDEETGMKVIALLEKLKHEGKTIIVTTHDARISRLADQAFALNEGALVSWHE